MLSDEDSGGRLISPVCSDSVVTSPLCGGNSVTGECATCRPEEPEEEEEDGGGELQIFRDIPFMPLSLSS